MDFEVKVCNQHEKRKVATEDSNKQMFLEMDDFSHCHTSVALDALEDFCTKNISLTREWL